MPAFQYVIFLSLLVLLPVMLLIFFYARNRKKKVIKMIGDESLVKQLMGQYNSASFLKKFIFLFLAMGILVLALANLRTPSGGDKINRNGVDVMIALDVSKSMLAQDIKPNRLERAKQVLSRLIDRMSNDRIGIVVFAGKAYLQMPLSGDHAAAKMYLNAATPESIPTQGTVIGDALKMCYASFNSKEKKYKAVILISDGEDHDESALTTAEQMASEGVLINAIGIGSPQGAPIMDEATGDLKKDNEGNTVISRLNEEELKDIAAKGNGAYQLFVNTEDVVNNIAAELNTMDQRNIQDDSLMNYQSYFQYFLGAAFLLLLIELFLSETKKQQVVKKIKPAVAVLLMLLLPSAALFAQSEKEIIKQGNDAYAKKNYDGAQAAYGTVVKKNPANATAQYNLGNATYKGQKVDEAVVAYDNAIAQLKTPLEKSKAFYNKGVVLQNNNKIPECIDAYKNALKLNQNDEDARHNLQKALQQQKEKNQQDQKNKNKNKDQDQQKNKDQQDDPKPQPSRLTKKDAEEKLKALMQQEKNLQDKLHKVNAQSVNKPEKDW
ncbi:MAG: hypothetical protein JWQ27_1287 [Ferruginibacter sp.]|nr:hypothetical protein [Ferruginibacter sp.]